MATLLAGTQVYVKDDEKGFVQAEVKAVSGNKVRRYEEQKIFFFPFLHTPLIHTREA